MLIKKFFFDTSIIAIIIFSAIALWTNSTKLLYIIITLFCGLYIFITKYKKNNLNKIFSSNFFIIYTISFCLFSIDASIRSKVNSYNYDFQLFTWGTTIIVMLTFLKYKSEKELIDLIYISCKLAVIGSGLYIIFTTNMIANGRIIGRLGDNLSGNVITVAMYLGTCSLVILYKYLLSYKIIDLILYLLVNILMLLSGSKLVFFNILCSVIMYVSIGKNKIKKIIIVLISLLLLTIIIITNDDLYNVIGARTIDFLNAIGIIESSNAQYSNSTVIRLKLIEISLNEFLKSPLIGKGFGIVESKPPYFVYSHNNFLEILACYGIIGFILFYSMYFITIRQIEYFIQNKNLKKFLKIMLLNMLFYDLTQITYTAGWLNYFGLIISTCFIIQNKKKGCEKYKNEYKA